MNNFREILFLIFFIIIISYFPSNFNKVNIFIFHSPFPEVVNPFFFSKYHIKKPQLVENQIIPKIIDESYLNISMKHPIESKMIEVGDEIRSSEIQILSKNYSENNYNLKIITRSNLFICSFNTIYYQRKLFHFSISLQSISISNYIPPGYPFRIIGTYENIISFGHKGLGTFGHFLLDYIGPLMLIPKEIRDISVYPIAYRSLEKFFYEGLEMVGIKKEQIISLLPTDLVFGHRIYSIDPNPYMSTYSESFRMLRNNLFKKLQLPKKPAFRIALYNRPKGLRHIYNFDLILNLLKKEWPKINFEVIPFYKSLFESALNYNEFKIIWIGCHGSAFGNFIFLQKESIPMEIHHAHFVPQSIAFSQALGLHHVIARDSKIKHMTAEPIYLNTTLVIQMFKSALLDSGFIK